jgi:hypothetical protein
VFTWGTVVFLMLVGCHADTGTGPGPDAGGERILPRDGTLHDTPPKEGSVPDSGSSDRGGQPCASPRPFVPPGQPAGWKHLITQLVVLEGAANHRGQDVVVVPGAPQLLIGKFAYGIFDKDLKGEDVEVFVQDAPPCGDWISLGTFETSDDGQYGTQYGVEDDGGRVFFTIPAGKERSVGRHPVRMLVKGDFSQAAFMLFVVPPGTSTVVFDIDGTLTTDDFQIIAQIFGQLLAGGYVPKLQAGAPAVAQAWAGKAYLPLYLTGRPDYLRSMSQTWLAGQGFPPGAMHLTDTNLQALPTSSGVGQFKTDVLKGMESKAQLDLYAAYGNATTDIQAYGAAGIAKSRTFIVGTNGGQDGTVAVGSYVQHLPTAQSSPAAAVPAPPGFGW